MSGKMQLSYRQSPETRVAKALSPAIVESDVLAHADKLYKLRMRFIANEDAQQPGLYEVHGLVAVDSNTVEGTACDDRHGLASIAGAFNGGTLKIKQIYDAGDVLDITVVCHPAQLNGEKLRADGYALRGTDDLHVEVEFAPYRGPRSFTNGSNIRKLARQVETLRLLEKEGREFYQ